MLSSPRRRAAHVGSLVDWTTIRCRRIAMFVHEPMCIDALGTHDACRRYIQMFRSMPKYDTAAFRDAGGDVPWGESHGLKSKLVPVTFYSLGLRVLWQVALPRECGGTHSMPTDYLEVLLGI